MKNSELTPSERVLKTLYGEYTGKVPFTIYETKLPRSSVERELRNQGLCLVRRTTSYKVHYPNVKVRSHHYTDEKGKGLVKTQYSTPMGDLFTLTEPSGYTTWTHERLFKTPDDYKALLFLIRDTVYTPDYNNVFQMTKELGGDYVVRDSLPSEPLQSLMSHYMGMETYCYQWMDNRDDVLKLYDALVENARKVYSLVAEGPLLFANYGGNVTPQIVGLNNFIKYYVPHYQEAAEVLHKKGKRIGCHLDGNNTQIMTAVSETELDYIEAYDPGMGPSVMEARKEWPNKVLWLNWPSSGHLHSPEEVKRMTIQIMEEAEPLQGFIMGVTEDVPPDRLQINLKAIMEAIQSYQK